MEASGRFVLLSVCEMAENTLACIAVTKEPEHLELLEEKQNSFL